MNLYHSNNIGNVAVLGHLGSGKTSVIEAMAKRAGISQQIGTISQGTTISVLVFTVHMTVHKSGL